MKIFFVIFGLCLVSADVLCTDAIRRASPAQFQCADTLNRADGKPRQIMQCQIRSEYCYEATGGAALSHGAKCLPLPKPEATCKDLVIESGESCNGDPATGIHVGFAFP